MGNTEYSLLNMNTDWSFDYDNYDKKRYIVKYNNKFVDTIHTTIQKNSSRKFIKLIKILRLKEKESFLNSLFSTYDNKTFISLKKGGNDLIISYSENFYDMSSLIKYDGKYGYYHKGNYLQQDSISIFWEIDFDIFCDDIKNNSLKDLDKYVLNSIKEFEIDYNKELFIVNLFLDYV